MTGTGVLDSVGATVTIDGVERESVTVDAGATVHWSVSKEGYVTQEGDYTVLEDTVLPVTLKRQEYTITFKVSPTDASLTVNGSEVTLSGGTYTTTVKWGDTVTWSCKREGYESQNGSLTVDGDVTVTVMLEAVGYLSVSPAELTLPHDGGDETVTVTCSEGWRVDSHPSWLAVSKESGSGNGSVTLYVDSIGNTFTSRTGTVRFVSDSALTAQVYLTQEYGYFGVAYGHVVEKLSDSLTGSRRQDIELDFNPNYAYSGKVARLTLESDDWYRGSGYSEGGITQVTLHCSMPEETYERTLTADGDFGITDSSGLYSYDGGFQWQGMHTDDGPNPWKATIKAWDSDGNLLETAVLSVRFE